MHTREEESVVQKALCAMGKAAMTLMTALLRQTCQNNKASAKPIPKQHSAVTTEHIPFVENNRDSAYLSIAIGAT